MLTRLDRISWTKMGEPQPRAGQKNGVMKSEPARKLLSFEFPAFVSDWLTWTGYRNQWNLSAFHITQTVCRFCSRSVAQAFDKF